jgi:hypothetical protein
MSAMSVVILTVTMSTSFGTHIGLYAEMSHCRAAMDIIADEDPGAVVRCEPVVLREPVPVPPPRPDNLTRKVQP